MLDVADGDYNPDVEKQERLRKQNRRADRKRNKKKDHKRQRDYHKKNGFKLQREYDQENREKVRNVTIFINFLLVSETKND